MGKKTEVHVEGRRLLLSNLDKVFYPDPGFTKAQVIDYYTRVAPAVLPHLRDRPVTLKRYPDGVDGQYFYEKRCPVYRPDWVPTADIWSEGNQADITFCVINDLPTLIWAANLANLELHTYLHHVDSVERPTVIAFDLDPGPPAGILECCRVGLLVRDLFADLGLACYPKTSGSKGMQVYVPLNTPGVDYVQTKSLARAVAELLEKQYPDLVVSNMRKSLRVGKVLVDWSQNDAHKTTVSVYSLRAKDLPTVSTPVTWDEIEHALARNDGDLLTFQVETVLERIDDHGDLFLPVLTKRQELPRLH